MADPRMLSLHLEGDSRRDSFRQARALVEAACGHMTVMGDIGGLLAPDDPGDGPTLQAPLGVGTSFYLRDGDNLHPLVIGVNSVGRLPDNTIVIRDEHVSRRHCAVIVHSDGRCELHDVASKNGTMLNGRKIPGPSRLVSGDEILLCTRRLQFLAGPQPQAKSAG
jgi:pSer/pThr/pTyr-binding forkhead associated (FHA) protein